MKGTSYVARLEGSRPRDGSRRLVLEIVIWVAAFALLLCQPSEYSRGTGRGGSGASHPDLVRAVER